MLIDGMTMAERKEFEILKVKLFKGASFLMLTKEIEDSVEHKRYCELMKKKLESRQAQMN